MPQVLVLADLNAAVNLLEGVVITLVLLYIAIHVLGRSHRADFKGVVVVLACVLVGLIIYGLATNTGSRGNLVAWLTSFLP